MLRFGQNKITNENFIQQKKTINVYDVIIENVTISKLVKTEADTKYLIQYLDRFLKPLVLKWVGMLRQVKLETKTIKPCLST